MKVAGLQIIPLLLFMCFTLALSCQDEKEEIPEVQYGSMTDIDGNLYKTVYINGKWWMAENLKVKTFRDGTPIENLVEDTSWSKGLPGWCKHPSAAEVHGLLYNWAAVSNPSGLAPTGWHIATDQEWKELESFLGMEQSAIIKTGWRGSDEGDQLKSTGITNWYRYDPVWGLNKYGFSALAGSCRLFNGQFGDPGVPYTGFWWTASEYTVQSDEAWYRYLDYKSSAIFRQHMSKQYGCSIRCVKD